MTKMSQEIVGVKDVHNTGQQLRGKQCNVIFIGNCSTPSNSTVKGHMRSPGNKPLVRYLKQVPNTFVDATNIARQRTAVDATMSYTQLSYREKGLNYAIIASRPMIPCWQMWCGRIAEKE